jgi:hypothetical protein
VAGLIAGTVVFGQGCGQFKSPGVVDQSSQSSSAVAGGLPKDFEAKPNTLTVSMTYSRQTLASMISCTGVKTSDATIDAEFARRKGSMSEYGYATQVTGPMLMAGTAVAGEVCNKLVANEAALAADQRRIFNRVDFTRGPASIASTDLRDVTRRLARSCWSRNETDDEFLTIESSLQESFTSSSTGTATKAEMLMLCTGMLSSLSGLEM